MHIMIQITDHVELYYTVRQIIKKKKKDSVGKIFFFLFPNAQLFTHTLEHAIFFFLDQLQPVQRANDWLSNPDQIMPCVSLLFVFSNINKHLQNQE